MPTRPLDVQWCRQQFPSLQQTDEGRPFRFFDGPAGTQVPQAVIDEIGRYMVQANANLGGQFATSQRTDAWMSDVHQAMADFFGCADSACVAFGANMTSLTFALSRALAKTWAPGDEIVLTRLEHDANFTPWVLAAKDAGATVRYVEINPEDCTLRLEDLRNKLSDRTRLIAVGCASNAVGTRNPVQEICRWASEVGAISFLDAVHFAPHDLIDVEAWGCDFLVCSAYKFFGPHQGIMYGRRDLLESLEPYRLRPAPNGLPGRWMTGTQNHECMAGTLAAIDYLAQVGRHCADNSALERREALRTAFASIVAHERQLVWQLIDGLQQIEGAKVWGIRSVERADERLPTVAVTHPKRVSKEIAAELGRLGFFVWHGNYYAVPLTETIGVDPNGMVRIGIAHYNTSEEVTELLAALASLLA